VAFPSWDAVRDRPALSCAVLDTGTGVVTVATRVDIRVQIPAEAGR
jgi:hypothetical protein